MYRNLTRNIYLITPVGKINVPIEFVYEDDSEAVEPLSVLKLSCNGTLYEGRSTDWLWAETFADLQSKLPHGYALMCCMTCRYGNMCPYGNWADRLYCTKELTVTDKMALCDLFDGTDMSHREVTAFSCCEDFEFSSEEHFTYNDFELCLKEKKCRNTPGNRFTE